jgi:hypothetical protein
MWSPRPNKRDNGQAGRLGRESAVPPLGGEGASSLTPNDRVLLQQPTKKQQQPIKTTPRRTTLTALRPTLIWDRRLLLHQTKTLKQSPIRKGSSGPRMGATM